MQELLGDGSHSGTFYFQSGVFRQPRALPTQKSGERPPSMDLMYNQAAMFLDFYYPQHAYVNVHNRISLFTMDYQAASIDKLTDVGQISDGATVLIAVTGPPESHPSLLIPHNVSVHSYKTPTFCDYCGEMLYGLMRQGLKCHGCGHNFHKRCADKVPNSCTQSKRNSLYNYSLRRSGSDRSSGSEPIVSVPLNVPKLHEIDTLSPSTHRSSISSFGRPQWIDRAVKEAESEGKTRKHEFAIHNYMQPTVCSHCRKLLLGVFRQGFRCRVCRLNAHKGCRKHMSDVICVPHPSAGSFSGATSDDSGNCLIGVGDDPDDELPNIPLQRICMSVRRSPKAALPDLLYSDWVLYRKRGGGDDDMPALRYWHLDTRDLRIVDSERPGDRDDLTRCTTIPLTQIMHIIVVRDQGHVFSMTVNDDATYDIGETGAATPDDSLLAKYLDGTPPPPEIFPPHAETLDLTFRGALQRALDEKRTQTLLNLLMTAHRPVGGATKINQHTGERLDRSSNGMVSMTTVASDSALSMLRADGRDSASYMTQSESVLAILSESTSMISGDIPMSASSSHRHLTVQGSITTEEDMQYRMDHSSMKERPSQEMSSIYQVFADEMLGSGQFGIVLAGEHRTTGVKVAIKVVEKSSNQSDETNQQMKNEAKLLSSIDFSGVIRLYSMFESDKRLLIVMERMDSDMLDMILSSPEGRLAERVGRYLVFQILAALRYLHRKSIAHCDLKPENCLLTGDTDFPQVKLCDFGFARIIGERKFRKTVVGTPAYLAPEVLNNRGYNLSLDCWSLGVVVYVTLSGTFPFNEGEEITDQINSAEFLFPNNPWGSISAESQHLIINLLTLQPRKRYTTNKAMNHKWFACKQLWEDLRALETRVDNRYITHEAEDDFWQRGGELTLERFSGSDDSVDRDEDIESRDGNNTSEQELTVATAQSESEGHLSVGTAV